MIGGCEAAFAFAAFCRRERETPAELQSHPLTALAGLVDEQALVLAYAGATFAIALVAFLGIPLVFLMRKPKAAVNARPKRVHPLQSSEP